ncbi:hypothetical protein Ae406Ps2_3022c [Pseudonocardia sp. Ae406_Ps2]|nr:hypothetical protein Ae406Ps2_3022c [Pseudonocardia sp. Ae406_Ps2]OLM12125.1 hypothetical protein Ae505Ps2_2252 [Pseudonocardia sp. Ae505_Ps2]
MLIGVAGLALAGVFGPLPTTVVPLVWVAIGMLASEAVSSWLCAAGAWRELRELCRNAAYLAAVIEVDAAGQRAEFARLGSDGDVPPAGGAA